MRLGSGHRALRAGQAVRVGVVAPTAPVHAVVPASCIVKDGDEHYVVVLGDAAGPRKQPVEIEAKMAGRAAVTGVTAGERLQLKPPAPKKPKKKDADKKEGRREE